MGFTKLFTLVAGAAAKRQMAGNMQSAQVVGAVRAAVAELAPEAALLVVSVTYAGGTARIRAESSVVKQELHMVAPKVLARVRKKYSMVTRVVVV